MRSRDVAVVTQWYLESESRIRSALWSRLSRNEEVEDLSHEVFLRLLKVPSPDLVDNPQAYVYRVALNVAQEWRKRASQALDHSASIEVLEAEHDPEREAASLQEDQVILRLIQALPMAQRTAIVLHVIDGLTCKQVADHMGVSRRAVKRYLANGYAALRDHIAVDVRASF